MKSVASDGFRDVASKSYMFPRAIPQTGSHKRQRQADVRTDEETIDKRNGGNENPY